jgi:hypothetical protein
MSAIELPDLWKPQEAAERTRAIIDLRDSGMSAPDIAAELAIDYADVLCTLMRLGL